MCGIVTGVRTVITKAKSTMAIVTIEDLQGADRGRRLPAHVRADARPTWVDGAILLVAGRVDHRGEEVSLLADLVVGWDDAEARGAETFAREVAAGDRSNGFRRRNGNGSGRPGGSGNGGPGVPDRAPPRREPVAVGPGLPEVARVSPLRTGAAASADPAARDRATGHGTGSGFSSGLPQIEPAEPIGGGGPSDSSESDAQDRDREPALPDEARATAAAAAVEPTRPLDVTGRDHVLHVWFGGAPPDRIVHAMEGFRQLVRERPGDTAIVVHVPGPGGEPLPMPLRQSVAYDADLLAEVKRQFGAGVTRLDLA